MMLRELHRRRNLSNYWNGDFNNLTEEVYISDVSVKWGVTQDAWSIRFSADKSKIFIGTQSLSNPNYALNCLTTNINDWTLASQGVSDQMRSIHISQDGTRLFGAIFGVKQWTLSTPYDLSTATYNGKMSTGALGVFMNPSEDIMVMCNADKLEEYSLTTPATITIGVTLTRSVTIGFNPDGIVYYNSGKNVLIGNGSGTFYKCSVTTPYTLEGFVLGSAIVTPNDYSVSTGTGVHHIGINETAKKLYLFDIYGKAWQLSYQ